MADPDPHEHSSAPPPESAFANRGPQESPGPSRDQDPRVGEDRYLLIAEKIFGSAMMFIGFLNILLSISGGYEINTVPIILYCGGLAIWAHATVRNPTVRYTVMATAIIVALAFFHYGDVLFWHKQLFFWGTIAMVVFFMFRGSTPPTWGWGDDDDRGRHSNP